MVTNGLYQHKEDGVMSGTHRSSHSQISDYNTLGERDYEVVEVNDDCKRDYNHLHRPSPPLLPSGRNGTFVFASSKEFHSMSTLSSQLGSKVARGGACQGAGQGQGSILQQGVMSPAGIIFPLKSASVGPEDHVYRELEQKNLGYDSPRRTSAPSANPSVNASNLPSIYRPPTDSVPPDSARLINRERGTFIPQGIDEIDEGNFHEVLYFPPSQTSPPLGTAQCNRIQPGGLEHKPETGNVFSEPMNPTAFPVHNYEKISTDPEYETPIITRKKTASSNHPPVVSRPSQTGMRGRSDSGVHYETEITQSYNDSTSIYNKLMRNSGDQGSKEESFLPPNSETHFSSSRLMSCEGNATDTISDPVVEGARFGISPADLEGNTGSSFKPASFDNPSSQSVRCLNQEDTSQYRPHSSSSASDSFSSYLNRLQEGGEEGETMGNQLLDDIVASFDVNELSFHREGERPMEVQRRAWSEERQDEDSRVSSGSMYARQSGQGINMTTGRVRLQSTPLMCRDAQTNGIELRLPEYARLKTIV